MMKTLATKNKMIDTHHGCCAIHSSLFLLQEVVVDDATCHTANNTNKRCGEYCIFFLLAICYCLFRLKQQELTNKQENQKKENAEAEEGIRH
jgi:hypothetical protein